MDPTELPIGVDLQVAGGPLEMIAELLIGTHD
jgi:hypothetical protein